MDIRAQELSLREKLATEIRKCPGCRMEITNPFIERCPRCYALIPHAAPDCPGCFHRSICPVKPPNA